MTQALQEQDHAFGAAQAQMRSAVSQLGRVRTDTEELIHARVRQVVAHVLAQEQELLEGVNARYQRDYEEIASQLSRLDAVLQRIRVGSALVQRMKRYASDQEVLDMHSFLRQALHSLSQEEPQKLRAAVRTDSFDEFKVRLQDLVSCITQGTGKPPSCLACLPFQGLGPAAASWERRSSGKRLVLCDRKGNWGVFVKSLGIVHRHRFWGDDKTGGEEVLIGGCSQPPSRGLCLTDLQDSTDELLSRDPWES